MIYCPDGRTISPFRVAIAFTADMEAYRAAGE